MEDAVLHGCIPVILQDGIHTPWESVLDAPTYSLRVRRADMPNLLHILRKVPPHKVAAMQAALQRIWPRFSYLSVAAAEAGRQGHSLPVPVVAAASRDAVATLLQVLRVRLRLRSARRHATSTGSRSPILSPRTGCGVDGLDGSDAPMTVERDPRISAQYALQVADGEFEGRTVNGWVI